MERFMRDFNEWFSHFTDSISDYKYYVDFEKVYINIDKIKIELNILNSLIGSKNIERDFEFILAKYPETLKCIPIILAVRERELFAMDEDGEFSYSFTEMNYSIEQYKSFMRKTGLFELLQGHIGNLIDYVTGVETGLGSHGRKNRGGHLMENLVEAYIKKEGLRPNETYFREMTVTAIEKKWPIDLSEISNQGKAEKRFDFVIKTSGMVFGIETNFYSSSGSKLNETARSYKTLALEAERINGFTFVWITDGQGWQNAKSNLQETFDVTPHVYNINDLRNGALGKLLR
jgi:type II restriction enzyme